MPPKGYKLSEESKRKISVNRTKVGKAKLICKHCGKEFETHHSELRKGHGKYCSRECASADRVGKPISDEHKQAIGNAHRGKTVSEETRKKLSESRIGHHWSEEDKKRMSQQRKGKVFGARKPLSEEHKRKLSIAGKGRKLTDEHRRKIAASNTGIKRSLEWVMNEVESKIGGFWYGNVRYYHGPQYCEKWNENLRERVRAFFGYKCIECGEPQNGKRLMVHHVHYRKDSCCNPETPRYFVPLCNSCHSKTNHNREYWKEYFEEIIETYYDGRCYLTKEEYSQLTNKL